MKLSRQKQLGLFLATLLLPGLFGQQLRYVFGADKQGVVTIAESEEPVFCHNLDSFGRNAQQFGGALAVETVGAAMGLTAAGFGSGLRDGFALIPRDFEPGAMPYFGIGSPASAGFLPAGNEFRNSHANRSAAIAQTARIVMPETVRGQEMADFEPPEFAVYPLHALSVSRKSRIAGYCKYLYGTGRKG